MSFESGLAGKVAIVTGGSRGIGRAIVECLAAQGVDVNFFYRGNEAAALEVVASVTAAGGKATALQVDVSDSAACIEAVNTVADRCERIDILINNAGIVRDNLMAVMEDTEISEVLETNIGGVFNVTRPVIPFMMSQRSGRIVNLSSVAGNKAGRGQANYAASKGAIDTFTMGLAKEVATEGIRVNGVRPGLILTDIHASGGQPERAHQLANQVPMQRPGTAEEVAQAVVWLLSDAASYVTASMVNVGGGR